MQRKKDTTQRLQDQIPLEALGLILGQMPHANVLQVARTSKTMQQRVISAEHMFDVCDHVKNNFLIHGVLSEKIISRQYSDLCISLIRTIDKQVLLAPNVYGQIPLHIALLRCHMPSVIHALLQAAPKAIYIRTKIEDEPGIKIEDKLMYPVSIAICRRYDIDTIRMLYPGEKYMATEHGDSQKGIQRMSMIHKAIEYGNSIETIKGIRVLSAENIHWVASGNACVACLLRVYNNGNIKEDILLGLAPYVSIDKLFSVIVFAINMSTNRNNISSLFYTNPSCAAYPIDVHHLSCLRITCVNKEDAIQRSWYLLHYMLVWTTGHRLEEFEFDDDLLIQVYEEYPDVAAKMVSGVLVREKPAETIEIEDLNIAIKIDKKLQGYSKTTALAMALGRQRYHDTRLIKLLFYQYPDAVNTQMCNHGQKKSNIDNDVVVEMIKHRLDLKIIQDAIAACELDDNGMVHPSRTNLFVYHAMQQDNYVPVIEYFINQLTHDTYGALKDVFDDNYDEHESEPEIWVQVGQKTPLLQLLSLPNNHTRAIMAIMALDGAGVYEDDDGYAFDVLTQALKHRNYKEIVQFILEANKKAATILPLPLYTALTTHCEHDVVQCIYDAFPRAMAHLRDEESCIRNHHDFNRLKEIPKFHDLLKDFGERDFGHG